MKVMFSILQQGTVSFLNNVKRADNSNKDHSLTQYLKSFYFFLFVKLKIVSINTFPINKSFGMALDGIILF